MRRHHTDRAIAGSGKTADPLASAALASLVRGNHAKAVRLQQLLAKSLGTSSLGQLRRTIDVSIIRLLCVRNECAAAAAAVVYI